MENQVKAEIAPAKTTVDVIPQLAKDVNLPIESVTRTAALLAEGATVPFIARYRKEVTGGLDEVQIRAIEERRLYLLELEDRRAAILASISEQGKLTEDLKAKLLATQNKAELEDLYLPYKPKRRTRASIAREKGLQPLAEKILAQPAVGNPETEAAAFVDIEKGVPGTSEALAGARDIVSEIMAENAEVRAFTRRIFSEEGVLRVEVAPDKKGQSSKFEQYYEFSEKVKEMPSHRYLAIRRGETEEFLRAFLEVDADKITSQIAGIMALKSGTPYALQLDTAIRDGYKRLLAPSVETEVRVELKLRSDKSAVDVFAANLRNLLLASPLGQKATIGVDPGLRTGCKCAAVDATGKFLSNITIYLSQGAGAAEQAKKDFFSFLKKHPPRAIAVGNGTGGRETETFIREWLREAAIADLIVVQVSEAGASVYSASDVAREEFPDLDLTIRGAISIARRLQDPLAELVKIDPKAIGVGQYQHDVHQLLLQRKLSEVVESCVNHVGVALNTASAALLSYVAGISETIAKNIVRHREKNGPFGARAQLLAVAGVGPRTFQQCAGFLRVSDAENPLDRSAVHPERYPLVEQIAGDLGVSLQQLVGDPTLVDRISIAKYVGDGVGEPTLRDIVAELKKPGRDPRQEFAPPKFREDVREISDLKPGMMLEGVITNVTAFGAFVDIGVHQDGLVHVSQLSDRFIKDPAEVAKVGDKLRVKVMEIDVTRKRISLSARSDAEAVPKAMPKSASGPEQSRPNQFKGGGFAQQNRNDRGGNPNKGQGQPVKFSHNPFANLSTKNK